MDDPAAVDAALRQEADALLAGGVRDALCEAGEVHPAGSYALGTMAWRDLDLYLHVPPARRAAFVALGPRLDALLGARRLSFHDHTAHPMDGWLHGLYWGVRCGDGERAWKLDVWGFEAPVLAERLAQQEALRRRLTPETRAAIQRIKGQVWRHPDYRKRITSQDIHAAVLDAGARDAAAFWAHVAPKGVRPEPASP